ncbi:Zinc finger C2H2-type [Trinorchestia longiramus]|nr:Zinc finger C2H2-type [Trinorchestia longiramus]
MFGINIMAWNGRDLEKLEVLQNRVGCVALGTLKWMAANALSGDLGWSLFSKRMVKAVLNYKVIEIIERQSKKNNKVHLAFLDIQMVCDGEDSLRLLDSLEKIGYSKSSSAQAIIQEQLKSRSATRLVNSPHAKYNSRGQLMCIVCGCPVKSAILWQSHIIKKSHIENLKNLKEKQHLLNSVTKRKASNIPPSAPAPKRPNVQPSVSPVPVKRITVSAEQPHFFIKLLIRTCILHIIIHSDTTFNLAGIFAPTKDYDKQDVHRHVADCCSGGQFTEFSYPPSVIVRALS